MSINLEIEKIKESKEKLRVGLNLPKSLPFSEYVNRIPKSEEDLSFLFSNNERGFWYEFKDLSLIYQDAQKTLNVSSRKDPVGFITDKSGNGFDAIQHIASKRSVFKTDPQRIVPDSVDDTYTINLPEVITGSLFVASIQGSALYEEVSISASTDFFKDYLPKNEIVGILFYEGSITQETRDRINNYFLKLGAVNDYTNVTLANLFWRNLKIKHFPIINLEDLRTPLGSWNNCSNLISFPKIDFPSTTSVSQAWENCSSLLKFEPTVFTKCLYFSKAWSGCSSLTSFPKLELPPKTSTLDFTDSWNGCTSLVNFPENFFDNSTPKNLIRAFENTNLSQESIDGILRSLVVSGATYGILAQSGGFGPSSIGKEDVAILRSRNWNVNLTPS